MSDINVGAMAEALNDKMDRDAHNVQAPSAVVIEKQDPSADSNYFWYRKYSDGWVEQGGLFTNSARLTQITFPVVMANADYCALSNLQYGDSGWSATVTTCIAKNSRTTTGLQILCYYNSSYNTGPICWRVSGMAAS